MGRILAIDYGKVRTGLAVTDPLKIIATALETVATENLTVFLRNYLSQENVELFVIGLPVGLRSQETLTTEMVRTFAAELQKSFPDIPQRFADERFTSKMAQDSLIASGVKKQKRKDKGQIDKISAVIILQSYMLQMGL